MASDEAGDKGKSKKIFLNHLDSFQGKNIGKVTKIILTDSVDISRL